MRRYLWLVLAGLAGTTMPALPAAAEPPVEAAEAVEAPTRWDALSAAVGGELGALFSAATGEDRIWVDAQFPVDPSEELLAYAAAHNLPGCTEADITLVYSQGRKVWAPWSTGPNGGFDNQACDGASRAVYEWGLVEPPE